MVHKVSPPHLSSHLYSQSCSQTASLSVPQTRSSLHLHSFYLFLHLLTIHLLGWSILCVNLAALRNAQITGKTELLDVSVRMFLEENVI